MTFVTRLAWDAQYEQGSTRIPGPVYGVTLHWEGPHMGTWPHDECAGKVRTIERFHKLTRGWAGIAYTLLVCPHGDVFEGRGVGVRSAANGTSSIGGNDHWYAVCYLGGQGDRLTDAGKTGLVEAVRYLRARGAGQKVNGHRDHHATLCPGDEIYAWLQTANFEPSPEMTYGGNIDDALGSLTKAKRRARRGSARRKALAGFVRAIKARFKPWPKR